MKSVTLIPGDGIGPEVAFSAKAVVDALNLGIEWEIVNAGKSVFDISGVLVPDELYKSIESNRVVLKGPITTPIGKGFKSINVMLRQKYDLFTNIRPVKSIMVSNRGFNDIDLVIFRENSEGLYKGVENEISDDEVHALKIVTRAASERIIKAAFDYALKQGRSKVTLVHKANILKKSDGLFLEIGETIAKEYPDIAFESVIVDNMCMQLVMNPNQYDVIVTMNLYGDILSDLCAGLIGGLGLVPGANIGSDIAIFEAVHGSAPDIAGKGLANPTAMILSAAMMLEYMGYTDEANKIKRAVATVFANGVSLTPDLGGDGTTETFTKVVIQNL
ncbi:MAG: isocitrate/isopropylmalate family dehydrogenase [Bacillota bacterium]|nr:isocitrate/isopropylmalate family dehydrogenase [Bacillota bacterium]